MGFLGKLFLVKSRMGSTKFDIEKFTDKNDFRLWRMKMRALLIHHGLEQALEGEKGLPTTTTKREKKEVLNKAHSALILSLGNKVLREVSKKKSAIVIWNKLENLYMTKSLANILYLKAEIVHPQDDNREVVGRSFG